MYPSASMNAASTNVNVLIFCAALCASNAVAGDPLVEASGALPDDAIVWSAQNFGRLLARASDADAVKFGALLGDTAAYLANSDPRACLQMLLPSKFGPLRAKEWPEPFLSQQMSVQRSIVRAALSSPSPGPTEELAGPVVDRAIDKLRKTHGAAAVQALRSSPQSSSDTQYCLAWAHYYQILVAFPEREASLAVRWLNAP